MRHGRAVDAQTGVDPMCRLLAYAAPRPTSAAQVLGARQCELFELMSQLHDDGWGTMWLQGPGAQVQRYRASHAGHADRALPAVLHDTRATSRVVHLRLATRSMSIDVRNSHPFLADEVGFAHNGAIVPTDVLRDMLGEHELASVAGSTDSELYFALIRRGLRWGLSPVEAIRSAVHRIRGSYPFASLNAMLLTPRELLVVHANADAPVPYHDFAGVGELPLGHDEDYYRLAYQRSSDGTVLVTSTGLITSGWTALPQNTVLAVDLEDLAVRIEELSSQRFTMVA